MNDIFITIILRRCLLAAVMVFFMITGTLTSQQTAEMDLEMMQDQKLVAPVKVDVRKAASNPSLSVDSLKIRSVADHLEIVNGN